MKHPFINNRILSLYYVVFWLVIGLINFVIQVFWYDMDISVGLIESVVIFGLYPIMGSSIWFIIQYNRLDENDWVKNILFHFVAATIMNMIWLYLSYVLVKVVAESHIEFIRRSLPSKVLTGYLLYAGYVVFFYAVNYYNSLKDKIKKESEMKMLIRDAELSALKSQINPHFLFNSLNSISSLTVSRPEKAQEMVINLSSFMRYSLQHSREETVSLKDELDHIKLYLGIEKIRFGKKLNPVFEVEENCLKARIPNMILQPLLENAIKYGVYEATEPVNIVIRCKPDPDYFRITVENEYDAGTINNKGEGIGLMNIRQRLELIYGNPNLLQITDLKTSFKVELLLPQK
ncbi:sensor histidine kinase [Mangrovibacterium diazotrophicum]|uniref:Histidine kinase n=1 Tax=Mangrovibacterium diazotrophicum TaxID=1261403 RepID=A0A419W8H9_9BACT|nr:histidine kinase [Mangrovibacterium diazotrophicum]RKD91781.1 histidine kinase [Mangrovibacterium diazotrophicum]